MFDYKKYFDCSDIIKTNMQDISLNMDMVTAFLDSKGINYQELNM